MFVRTDRLLLRPGWPEDASALAAAIGEERIVRNLATAPWPYGLREAEAYLAQPSKILPSFLMFANIDDGLQLAGGIGLSRSADGEFELGYWVAPEHWGRGYATEAGHAVLALARDSLRLRRIVSGHFLDNPASGRVLEKLGFASAGEIGLRHSRARGEDVPFMAYALSLCEAKCGEPELMAA